MSNEPLHFYKFTLWLVTMDAQSLLSPVASSQGQTISLRDLNLGTVCFYGQYVACYRVGKPSSLFVLGKYGHTKNIVNSIALRG